MRRKFREWYAPTEDELKALWAKAIFVIDANVLLGLYQYPPRTLQEFLKVLEDVKERLWLPYQAGMEFQRNRERSLPQQRSTILRLIKTIEDMSASLGTLGLPEYHPVLELAAVEAAMEVAKTAFDDLLQPFRDALLKTPEFSADAVLKGEPVRDRVTELFQGRVGEPFSPDELRKVYVDGADRYAREVPPGYKDRGKDEPERYADYVIWREILQEQKRRPQESRATILITNDRKEDWWLRKNEQMVGPRPELVREYLDEVGADFFMYTPAEFLSNAPKYLSLTVSKEAIADVGRISTSSSAAAVLRLQRMVLPEPSTRIRALSHIYEEMASGRIGITRDLNTTIENLGDPLTSSYVEAPLFFSLVNESYGPVVADHNPSVRLRDRAVRLRDECNSRDAFVRSAHAAWLAQALFRIRYEGFSDDELLVAFFGDGYPEDAASLIAQAHAYSASDVAFRGR